MEAVNGSKQQKTKVKEMSPRSKMLISIKRSWVEQQVQREKKESPQSRLYRPEFGVSLSERWATEMKWPWK